MTIDPTTPSSNTSAGTVTELVIFKTDLTRTELRQAPHAALSAGQLRLAVGSFALTANNITYAALGDAMSYWAFYPVDAQWGVIPVWGFADVVESTVPELAVGERIYGYFPMASHCVLSPTRISPAGFVEGAAHRAALHGVYNQYTRCQADPFYASSSQAIQALLRPLFMTSWLIDDFLADNDFFGAVTPQFKGVMLLSSASSKTAYGTAFQLAKRDGVEVVGLTSPANVAFCESLGCYHRVLSYDQLHHIAADTLCIYVDFAGNVALRKAIHTRFVHLKFSSSIGATHVDQMGGAKDTPGVKPTLFFAPSQVKKRVADWGSAEFGKRLFLGWQEFVKTVSRTDTGRAPWLTVEQHSGALAVQKAYAQILSGRGDPRVGHMLSLGSPLGSALGD